MVEEDLEHSPFCNRSQLSRQANSFFYFGLTFFIGLSFLYACLCSFNFSQDSLVFHLKEVCLTFGSIVMFQILTCLFSFGKETKEGTC